MSIRKNHFVFIFAVLIFVISTAGGLLSPLMASATPKIPSLVLEKPIVKPTVVANLLGTEKKSAKKTGIHFIPINTHVHPNWVFTAPGTYKVVIKQHAKLKNGQEISVDSPLTFIVGGQGNANAGHFDLGSDFKDGKFISVVRDDSKVPPQYVDPSTLTFGLGEAAKEKAPKGIEFIAAAGAEIYRIPEVQKEKVPWLGANTMNPGVLQNVTGGVYWSLASFTGPGQMALFSGGGFSGDYKVWLNTREIGISDKSKVEGQPPHTGDKMGETGSATMDKSERENTALVWGIGIAAILLIIVASAWIIWKLNRSSRKQAS